MPALSTAGRDVRLPDGSKIRIICHKVAVQVTALDQFNIALVWMTCASNRYCQNKTSYACPHVHFMCVITISVYTLSKIQFKSVFLFLELKVILGLIEKTPEITWGTCIITQHVSNADFTMSKDAEKVVKITGSDDESEDVINMVTHDGILKEMENEVEVEVEVEKDTHKLSVPFICVLGMLQRITVKVPDKSQSRLLVLGSITSILNALQEVKTKEDEEDDLRLQVRTSYLLLLCGLIVIDSLFIQRIQRKK